MEPHGGQGHANHLLVKLRGKFHRAARITEDYRGPEDRIVEATLAEHRLGAELGRLVARFSTVDAVGTHQQEAPDAGTLCRLRHGLGATVLQGLESDALARKLAQDADVVYDRVAACQDRVDGGRRIEIARR